MIMSHDERKTRRQTSWEENFESINLEIEEKAFIMQSAA